MSLPPSVVLTLVLCILWRPKCHFRMDKMSLHDRQMWEWVGMTKQYRWYLRGCLPERSERLDRLVREAGGLAFLLAKKAAEGAATA